MGFLARSRDRLLLPRRLARWRKEPSKEALSEAVQCLLRLGEAEQALALAREGSARFRDDRLVRELHRLAARARAEQVVAQAEVEIRERPTSQAYLRLARGAIVLRDATTALRTLTECLKRFPGSAQAHASMAELLEQRWLRDLAAADGRSAVGHWRKAWRLEGSDASRPLRLAAFLARIGAVRSACATLEAILQLDPGCAAAGAMKQELAARIESAGSEASGAGDLDDDVDAILQRIEEQGRLDGDPGDDTRVGRECEQLRAALPALRAGSRCEKAIVLAPAGEAWDESGPVAANPLTILAANLARTAQLTTRRADLGPLATATLETAGGVVVLRRSRRCCVALLVDGADAASRGERALAALVDGRAATTAPAGPGQPMRGGR